MDHKNLFISLFKYKSIQIYSIIDKFTIIHEQGIKRVFHRVKVTLR